MVESTAQAGELPRGRTPPLSPADADDLFRRGVALFNGVRYWHAHEAWETLWRAAPDDERDFYQGLIQLAAGSAASAAPQPPRRAQQAEPRGSPS